MEFTLTQQFWAELIGTMLLLVFGNGVCANASLQKSKGYNFGFGFVVLGWAVGVALVVFMFRKVSGAHFNPAITIAFAMKGVSGFTWDKVTPYLIAQFVGAFLGAAIVVLNYYRHFVETEDKDAKLGIFCTMPAIRNIPCNFMTEFIATFVLVFVVMGLGCPNAVGDIGDGFASLTIGMLILAIGYCLGGPTGFAINPARDLGPRLAHFLIPMGVKRDSDWSYAWVPIVAPILGGIAAVYAWLAIFANMM